MLPGKLSIIEWKIVHHSVETVHYSVGTVHDSMENGPFSPDHSPLLQSANALTAAMIASMDPMGNHLPGPKGSIPSPTAKSKR